VDRSEQAQELVLGGVGVLELVDQDVAEAAGVALEDVVALLEQLDDPHDQVAEVDRVGCLQRGLVPRVHLERRLAGHVVLRNLHLGGQQAGILPAIDSRQVLPGGAHVEAQIAGRPLRLRELIRVVVDGEAPRQPQRLRLAAEDPRSGGVERRHPEPLRVRPDQLLHPLAQLAGGLVGERDGEDLRGPRQALAQEVRDAMGENARLSRACARQDEQRPFAVAHGLELRRVQDFGERVRHIREGTS